ncbi:hypothetical protein TNCV_3585231 [Trichonephila clavipes]|nr:hypothetical protein TNCV_3585231 [Trichonephila clavipes]
MARLTSLRKEFDPVDDETDEDEDNNNNESSKGPSNADVFPALEISMEWYEQQSECCLTQLLLLKKKKENQRPCSENNEGVQWCSEK